MSDEVKYKEYTIKIWQDEIPQNPREDDNLGTMVCFHGRYSLGDRNHGLTDSMFRGWAELEQHLRNSLDAATVLPIYMYDHSGITISVTPFSCPWDSGQVEFIYISKEKARKEYGWKKLTKDRLAKLEEYLTSEVDTYDKYLTGDIYGYNILNPDGTETDEGMVGGYFGYDHEVSGLLVDARSKIDYEVEVKEEIEALTKMSKKELPLHVNDQFKSQEARKVFNDRFNTLQSA